MKRSGAEESAIGRTQKRHRVQPWRVIAEAAVRDARYSVRTLVRNPGFTIVTLLTLALGIGANTAMFSVVEAIVLAPLPFPESDRLVFLWQTRPGVPQLEVSEPNFEDWQRDSRSFQAMSAVVFHSFNLSSPGSPEHVVGMRVSSEFLATLRVRPVMGRDFTPADNEANAAPAAVVSERLWRERLGGDPRAVGRGLVLDGRTFTVAGVLPAAFQFLTDSDVITTLRPGMPAIYAERSVDAVAVLARLKPGVTMRQAEGELGTIQQELDRRYPDANRNIGVAMTTLKQQMIGDVRSTLLLLFGAVTLVLLIACANVANLALARANVREREFGVRSALGASRGRMIRQVLTESLVLSVAGGALGVAVATVAVRVLLAALPEALPRSSNIGLNGPLIAFTFCIAIMVGVLFGVVPAMRSARTDLRSAMQQASRGTTGGRHGVLKQLVVLQFALTLVLLAGSGLLLRSIRQLWRVNPGFDTRHLISFKVGLSPSVAMTPDGIRAAYRQMLERMQRIPGVEGADLTNLVPLSGGDNSGPFWIGTTQPESLQVAPHALYFWTGPDYLRTMGIPLLRGRFFSAADQVSTPKVVVIDEVLAQNYFAGEDPVGKVLTVGHWGAARIVGVAGHVRYWGLDDPGTYNPRQIYIPAYQLPDAVVKDFFQNLTVLVRSRLQVAELMPAIREAVNQAGADQPVYGIKTMEDVEWASMESRRLPILLLGAFAGLALLLAAVGIYGVVSYAVMQRAREIGIRIALGADKSHVFRMIVGSGFRMAAAGVFTGVVAAVVLMRVLPSFSHLLYGVGKNDPLTLIAVSSCLMTVALAACYFPARRAMRTDPMDSLRCE